jgi:hypothetical protein
LQKQFWQQQQRASGSLEKIDACFLFFSAPFEKVPPSLAHTDAGGARRLHRFLSSATPCPSFFAEFLTATPLFTFLFTQAVPFSTTLTGNT